jgi:hypothetical protein
MLSNNPRDYIAEWLLDIIDYRVEDF